MSEAPVDLTVNVTSYVTVSAESLADRVGFSDNLLRWMSEPAAPYVEPTRWAVYRQRIRHAWAALHGSWSECEE